MKININISENIAITARFSSDANIPASVGEAVKIADISQIPTYQGATEITPSNVQQVLNTRGVVPLSNIVVKPIPSNYGKITFDGYKLTVS